ncbi:hypothetical protein QYE76_040396 [Lolium multiflorum]|uniref:Reverse transcriptase Ty1/copia-type domain-containing protein n=1 Tax=Lolium multiflorum TaxID=4521 RepID=A0AAD8WVE3_LOLMU|nr:hypothetical protein QYE76_040396 [Lolium multiflorum]
MLKSAEIEIKKEHQVLMVNKTTSFKKQGKSKGKNKKSGKKAATPPVKPKTALSLMLSAITARRRDTGSVIAPTQSEDVPVPPAPATEEANDNDHETSNEIATEPRRSTRERATPDWYDPCLNVMIVDNNDEDPATYEEAMMSPDSNKWQEAMKSEMGSMYDNKVWTLVDLPDSRKAVENKWIFKRKTDADGNITVYKARLVAKGFRQIQGVDYDETFSPIAKLKSVRILLAIAAFFDYEIWQMDVKTAFLNGDIEEELYMRSIYGLKQASRSWNRRFDKVIKDFGFIQCHGEACIYKKVSGSSVAFLILYVDDILLIGNDIELLSSVKGYLNNSFSMKDLGEASYILGIKIYRDRSIRLIGLSQSTYLDKILKKFRMDESKKGFLPMLPGKVLSKTQGPATAEERERMSQIPYASAVGSIIYQSDPGMEHWTTVKNILKYLKRTKDMFLCYGGDQELVVTSYTDASWNTDPDDSKSQSGYVFILNGAAVSWASSKQCTVAKSSTESEYIAASEASSEAVWMKRFIVELGVVPSALDPLVIYCDNMGAIANAQEPRSHKRLKHIKLRYHSIREYIEDGEVKICKVHTDLNVADPLTKALPRAKHDQHQNAMGVRLLERDIFDLFLPEFDKPWVIHLRETCCCSTNLSLLRPNTAYKNRSTRRHQALSRRCGRKDKTLLDTTCSGSFTSNKEEFKRDLLDRIKENAEDWKNDKGKESGYADKPPFKPLPPKEGSEEREEEKKKKKGTKKKKKKKKENKKKEVTAYPRVNEITLGNRKYVAPNDYCDNESEYDDLPMPFTYISDHDLNEHTTFDITNLWETNSENDNNCHSVSAIHASSHNDIESSKLGEEVFENPFATGHYVLDTSPSNNNDGSFQGSREEDDILRSRRMKSLSLGMPRWFIPAYFKKTQASKLGDAQGIPFFIDKVSGSFS